MTAAVPLSDTAAPAAAAFPAAGDGLSRIVDALRPCLRAGRFAGLGLTIAPLLKGNADEGAEIYGGCYRLAGFRVISAGTDVFDIADADPAWLAALHGFGWLSALRASGRLLDRVHARAQIAHFFGRRHRLPRLDLVVTARRLIHLVQHAPFFLPGASDGFVWFLRQGIGGDVRRLLWLSRFARAGEERIVAAIALLYAAHGFRGYEALSPVATRRLAAELQRQILPDGGHVSRNPAVLLDLVSLLLPLRTAVEAAGLTLGAEVTAVVERMVPALRFFLMGDGGLAAFQGAGDPMTGLAAAAMAQDMVQGRPLTHAAYAGYVRFAQGPATLIMDVGQPVHARGRLAFEFSDGPHRVIVNCGAPAFPGGPWAELARAEAAHSTASLHSAEPQPRWQWNRATWEVAAEVSTGREGGLIRAWHNGLARVVHERQIYLSPDGFDLRGEDSFTASDGAEPEIVLRFHLHPAIRATLARDGASVLLVTPTKTAWRFQMRGGTLTLDESVSLTSKQGPRRALQIVIGGITAGSRVNWSMRRLAAEPGLRPQERAALLL